MDNRKFLVTYQLPSLRLETKYVVDEDKVIELVEKNMINFPLNNEGDRITIQLTEIKTYG
jgi:hypothetical protein